MDVLNLVKTHYDAENTKQFYYVLTSNFSLLLWSLLRNSNGQTMNSCPSPATATFMEDSEHGALNREPHKSFYRPQYIKDTSVTGRHGLLKRNYFLGHLSLGSIPHEVVLTLETKTADRFTLTDTDVFRKPDSSCFKQT
jgi:hypothetical protein